jgi:transposase
MPKKINYQLSKSEQAELARIEKTSKDPRMRQRAMGLRLLHTGKSPQEAAELLTVSVATIYNWHQKWRTGGIAGLADEQRSGRPAVATAAYCAKLEALIETEPSELGYGFTLWTAKRLLAHLEQETGIHLSEDTLRHLLQKHQFVYRRPKHDLKHLQDPETRATAAESLAELKKKPKPARSNDSLWTKRP